MKHLCLGAFLSLLTICTARVVYVSLLKNHELDTIEDREGWIKEDTEFYIAYYERTLSESYES